MKSSSGADRLADGHTRNEGHLVPSAAELSEEMDEWLAENGDALIRIRRHIHAHPELSGAEYQTTALVAERLVSAGLAPQLLPNGNGLFCDVGSGPVAVALRADLDALPIRDGKDVSYRSTVSGVSHACGHDVHTTVILGSALLLARLHDSGHLRGRVRLIFQPSEERTPSGAVDVIDAGGLQGMSAIFGLHCAPQLPFGVVAVRSGPVTAAADVVEVTLREPGEQRAGRRTPVDLIHAAGTLVTQAPALLSRLIDTRSGAAITFGALNSAVAGESVPAQVVVGGTVRVLDRQAWAQMPSLTVKMIEDLLAATGAEVDVRYERAVPPVVNDRAAVAAVIDGAGRALNGPDHIIEAEISMGGEDFAFYLEHVRGAMLRLGVAPPDLKERYDIHQSVFDVDERSISSGVRVMVHTALSALSNRDLTPFSM